MFKNLPCSVTECRKLQCKTWLLQKS